MIRGYLLFLFLFPYALFSGSYPDNLLPLLAQGGAGNEALMRYQCRVHEGGGHDFELLHRIALQILHEGFKQRDIESQLLALFGAGISLHEEAYTILEQALQHSIPEMQLVALHALSRCDHERADRALIAAIRHPIFRIRYEAVRLLCQKNHPDAIIHVESLIHKSSRALLPLYPPLLVLIEESRSTRLLRELMQHQSASVRLQSILSVVKQGRDDLLPDINRLATQPNFAQQEACAYALGVFKDEHAIMRLKQLEKSPYPCVVLAASLALSKLGVNVSEQVLVESAKKGDPFAIAALGESGHRAEILLALTHHTRLSVRWNATIALLHQRHTQAVEPLRRLLVEAQSTPVLLSPITSPGHTLRGWKVIPTPVQQMASDVSAYQAHVSLHEQLLREACASSPTDFILLADQLLRGGRREWTPFLITLLERLASTEAIACLKRHQQQFGAPFVRHACALALYRLEEEGPYCEILCQWAKQQNRSDFIRLRSPPLEEESGYQLTPEETSQLLIATFEALAQRQDAIGIEGLIEAISTGHTKNRYALAGLLLRATQ